MAAAARYGYHNCYYQEFPIPPLPVLVDIKGGEEEVDTLWLTEDDMIGWESLERKQL